MTAFAVHEEVGEAGGVGVQDLAGAVAGEVVGAAGGEPGAVPGGHDQRGSGFVGEGAVEVGVRQGLLGAGDHHVVQPRVGGEGAGAFEFGLAAGHGQVVEGDGEEPFARAGAVAEECAGSAGQPGGQQREGAGGGAAGEVGADARHRHPAPGPPLGRTHAGHRPGVEVGHVPGCRQPGADRLHQGVAYGVHGAFGVGGGRGHGEGGDRLVPGDLTRPGAQHEGVPRRNAPHALVRGGVPQRGRYVRGGEQGGQVAEVEVGLDEVGEGQRGGGVGRTAGPGGVEDRAGAGEVAADGDAAAHLDDGRVAARPAGQMAQCAPARGEQPASQLLVGGAADAEDGDVVVGVGPHHAHLVRAPVADGPQRIRVAPQELGADRVQGLAVVTGGARGTGHGDARGGAAPTHQPPHRRLHRLWTTVHRTNRTPMLP